MKRIYFLAITTFFFSISLFSQCANQANIFTFNYNSKTYEIVKEVKNWSNASACAVQRGGYLVEINSQAEQDTIYATIIGAAGISSTYASVSDGGNVAYVWMGGTDRHVEGTWLWDGNYDNVGTNFWTGQGTAGAGTGAAVNSSYVNWGGTSLGTAEEPDDYFGIQDCGAIGLATWPHGIAGEWNDISGLNNLYYVIEYDTLLGINNHEEKFRSSIYPNPANNVLNISVDNSNEKINDLKIYDQLGAIVYDEKINSNNVSVDVSKFSQGIYFLSLTFDNGEIENRKISVVR